MEPYGQKIIRRRKSMTGSDLLRMVSLVLGAHVGVLVQLAGLARQVKAGSRGLNAAGWAVSLAFDIHSAHFHGTS